MKRIGSCWQKHDTTACSPSDTGSTLKCASKMLSRQFHSSTALQSYISGVNSHVYYDLPLLQTSGNKWRQDVKASRWDALVKSWPWSLKSCSGLKYQKNRGQSIHSVASCKMGNGVGNAVCYVICVGNAAVLKGLQHWCRRRALWLKKYATGSRQCQKHHEIIIEAIRFYL